MCPLWGQGSALPLPGRLGRVWTGVGATVEDHAAGIPRRRGRSKGSSTAPNEQCGPCRPRTGPVCRFPGRSRVWPPAMEVSAVWGWFPGRRRREQEGVGRRSHGHGSGPATAATGHFTHPWVGQAERLACRKRPPNAFCGQKPAPTFFPYLQPNRHRPHKFVRRKLL